MKLLVCGAGRITDEFLKRVGLTWEITLIDKDETRLAPFSNRFPGIVRTVAADASSPVVLKRAGIMDQDCVLAMTNDDDANLALTGFAQNAGIKTVLAVVRDPEKLPEFRKLGIWTVTMTVDAARKTYQFIKDPRIRVVSLGEGEGELLEMSVEKEDKTRLASVMGRNEADWQVAGIFREGRLLFPGNGLSPEPGDRLLILGKADLYARFSGYLSEKQLHFPRTYGRKMVLVIESDAGRDAAPLLNEAVYLARATHVEKTRVVFDKASAQVLSALDRWSGSLEIKTVEAEDPKTEAVSIASDQDVGLVVAQFPDQHFIGAMVRNGVTGFASRLPCPLLCARAQDPYDQILVPFNGSLESQRAMEIALDLAQQLAASVTAVIVVEPTFLKGDSDDIDRWQADRLAQVRELSRVHSIKIEERVVHGNPVRQVAATAKDCQLLVIGAPEGGPGLFSTDIAGMMINRVACSVLVV